MILVFPDGFNSLGGSQYMNSVATGRYEDYIINDLIPYIDGKFRTLNNREHRGVVGKSSGGYGSVRLAMRHPETFSAMGSHSGDMYFEFCYKADFPKVVRAFTHHLSNPNPIGSYLSDFAQAEIKKSSDIEAMNILAMAACYSPREAMLEPSFDLPFDLHTGELKPEVWERWLEHDPVYMLQKPEYVEAMRQMKLIYLDAGTKDEFSLHLGARIFVNRLKQLDIKYHHEEFEAGHFNINYRYDTSLTHIWKALEG
jgi:enterochelin esterase family protein